MTIWTGSDQCSTSKPYTHLHSPLLNSEANTCRNKQLEQEITALAAHINAASYRLLKLIAEFERGQGWGQWGCRSCAQWLNWRCGIAMGAAREKVRTALALEKLPQISRAFRLGQLSYSKVRALTRIADSKNEEDLLMIAEYGSASHVENLVQKYRRVLRSDKLEEERDDAQRHHSGRALNYYWDDNGYLVIKVQLGPEQGGIFIKALAAAESALEQDDQHVPAGTPPREEDEGNPLDPPPRTRFENKRADAVTLIAEAFLQTGPEAVKTADRYQVVVHVNKATLNHIEDGPAIASDTARRLCCDSSIVHMCTENPGEEESLSIGRRSRSIPPSMRRALQQRDGGCRFPGCDATRFVDGHHIQHWADGGETKLDNLVLLCRHHHHKVHEGGFGLQLTTSGHLSFSRPDGQLIPGAPPLPKSDTEIEELNRQVDLNIDADTLFCWNGDTMDYGVAIDGLADRTTH